MAFHSLPILILNLGGEMFYVLDQRLKAQKVPPDKAQKVLNDIASVMLHERFLEEIFKTQQLYSKHELFLLFKEIAHASIMKLNYISMGKLYDLMIMVFKYQIYFVSRPRDILLVTLNHMDSLRNIVSSSFVNKQLDSVHLLLTKIYHPMRDAELQTIRYDLLNYLQDIHVKVSIFLRLGQQNGDGTFVNPIHDSVPYGTVMPGLIKIFNQDQSVKDIIAFPSGGEYSCADVESSFECQGNRGTKLGLSIYHEKTMHDFSWTCSESKVESDLVETRQKSIYRSEINTLLNQLIGRKPEESEYETIILDLFNRTVNEGKIVKSASTVQTVTIEDSSVRQNSILTNAAEEVNINLAQPTQENLFDLLENIE